VWFLNSVIVAGGVTLATLILASLAGYGFARTEFLFKNTIFILVLR
jgi:multiple sugar transport system permease protein